MRNKWENRHEQMKFRSQPFPITRSRTRHSPDVLWISETWLASLVSVSIPTGELLIVCISRNILLRRGFLPSNSSMEDYSFTIFRRGVACISCNIELIQQLERTFLKPLRRIGYHHQWLCYHTPKRGDSLPKVIAYLSSRCSIVYRFLIFLLSHEARSSYELHNNCEKFQMSCEHSCCKRKLLILVQT